jgi:hypothetical protein
MTGSMATEQNGGCLDRTFPETHGQRAPMVV